MLHGRDEYKQGAPRHLQGCYVEHDAFRSRVEDILAKVKYIEEKEVEQTEHILHGEHQAQHPASALLGGSSPAKTLSAKALLPEGADGGVSTSNV